MPDEPLKMGHLFRFISTLMEKKGMKMEEIAELELRIGPGDADTVGDLYTCDDGHLHLASTELVEGAAELMESMRSLLDRAQKAQKAEEN